MCARQMDNTAAWRAIPRPKAGCRPALSYGKRLPTYHLLVSADFGQATLKRLSMFILRAKVKASLLSEAKIYGLVGAEARQTAAAAYGLPVVTDWQQQNTAQVNVLGVTRTTGDGRFNRWHAACTSAACPATGFAHRMATARISWQQCRGLRWQPKKCLCHRCVI